MIHAQMPYGGGIRTALGGGGTAGWAVRRRAYRAGKKVAYQKVARYRRRATFRRGRDRTGGFYGRFAAPGRELKFLDVAIVDADIAVNGTIVEDSIFPIAQGVTESQRVGRKCTVRAINWRYTIQLDVATGAGASEVVRVILYLDKQCNGAVATVTGILETDDFQSFNNLANTARFHILHDKTYDLNFVAGAGNGTTQAWPEMQISDAIYKKVNIPLEFDSTTGAITELRSNNVGVLLVSQVGGLASFESSLRVRFEG